MPRLDKDVTLIAVDCLDAKKASKAIDTCLGYVKFENVKLLTSLDGDHLPSYAVRIAPIKSIEEYSRFMVKELCKYVDTPFCLVVQHDS